MKTKRYVKDRYYVIGEHSVVTNFLLHYDSFSLAHEIRTKKLIETVWMITNIDAPAVFYVC